MGTKTPQKPPDAASVDPRTLTLPPTVRLPHDVRKCEATILAVVPLPAEVQREMQRLWEARKAKE